MLDFELHQWPTLLYKLPCKSLSSKSFSINTFRLITYQAKWGTFRIMTMQVKVYQHRLHVLYMAQLCKSLLITNCYCLACCLWLKPVIWFITSDLERHPKPKFWNPYSKFGFYRLYLQTLKHLFKHFCTFYFIIPSFNSSKCVCACIDIFYKRHWKLIINFHSYAAKYYTKMKACTKGN